MTDKQLLLSLRLRAAKRISNFQFVSILAELILQTQRVPVLERDIMDRLKLVCQVYNLELDEYDQAQLAIERKAILEDQDRIKALHRSGFYIGT